MTHLMHNLRMNASQIIARRNKDIWDFVRDAMTRFQPCYLL